MALISVEYSAEDFKKATAALLPTGRYWQNEPSDDLDKLLSAMADEFKTTGAETQVSVLYQGDNVAAGWKLADYQTILDDHGVSGEVYDDSSVANLIYIDAQAAPAFGGLMKVLDGYRLPFTAFCAKSTYQQQVYVAIARQVLTINRRVLRAV